MKKLNLFNLVKGAVLVVVIALTPNALASSEVSLVNNLAEEISVVSTEFGSTSFVVPALTLYAYNLDGEVIEFDSTQDWFDSYQTVSRLEQTSEPIVNTSQETSSNTLSDTEQNFYEWVFDGAVYVLVNYVEHGEVLKDSVNFVGGQLGIETPDITTIDGLFNFVGEIAAEKVTEFLTYIFDSIWNGIASLF